MTIDPTYLAFGGIGAALAAGWQQAKQCFAYLSSFLVVRAAFDHQLSPAVRTHLKQAWRPLPSGLLTYAAVRLLLRGRQRMSLVPFRLVNQNAVFLRGWRFLLASGGGSGFTLMTLRGVVNFDVLVKDAIAGWERITEVEEERSLKTWSRFHVNKVIGREKGLGIGRDDKPTTRDGGQPSSGIEPASSSPDFSIDLAVDESFHTSRDDYVLGGVDDDPFRSLWYEPDMLAVIDQAERWLSMGQWYLDRDLPWRRGMLLHGPGGTGKSSLARALARRLRVPLYQFYLATLSDQEFLREWDDMAAPCVALLEDLDAVFDGRRPTTPHASLTFDCLLNAIDGVSSLRGVLLVVTTNNADKIDPALRQRPGRIDSVTRLGEMSLANRRAMAGRLLRDWPDEQAAAIAGGEGQTPAQFQEFCIQVAFGRLAEVHGDAAPKLRAES